MKFKFGRLEPRTTTNELAVELAAYLAALPVRIDHGVFQHLQELVRQHRTSVVQVEKAVDVMLAVDLVVMAERNEFDAAYLLSADGDYTHAVEFVRGLGKKVYAVSPRKGAQLAGAVNSYIPTRRGWYDNCYRARPSLKRTAITASEPTAELPSRAAISGKPMRERSATRPARLRWDQLMRRVFDIDVLACPSCGARMRPIAEITDRRLAKKMLEHVGLASELPACSPARGPPEHDDPPSPAWIDDEPR